MSESRISRGVIGKYFFSGWQPFYLPAGAKTPPPAGITGHDGRAVTMDDTMRWHAAGLFDNIGVKLPSNVVGLDVDTYGGKQGSTTLGRLEAEFGELPATVVSSRSDEPLVSGTRFFRVPGAYRAESFASGAGKDIDIIRPVHRYAVVAPSVHPSGDVYRLFAADGSEVEQLPRVEELPLLPERWCGFLADRSVRAERADAAPEQVREFLASLEAGVPDERVQELTERYINELLDTDEGGRHDAMVRQTLSLLYAGREGHPGVGDALAQLRRVFEQLTGRDGDEVDRAIESGVGLALAKPVPLRGVRSVDGDRAPTLPEEFWCRDSLRAVREMAHHYQASADAVLVTVLSRVSASLPHGCRVNTGARTPTSTNFFGAIVAPSGVGKSTAEEPAAWVFPGNLSPEVDGLNPGSGEGLVQAYLEYRKPDKKDGLPGGNFQVRYNVRFASDEGESLVKLMYERSGATLAADLRKMWSGKNVGSANASAETKRRLDAGSYSMSLSLVFQPDTITQLFDDKGSGTPQRFVFAAASDPSIPDEEVPRPEPVRVDFPTLGREFCLEAGSVRTGLRRKHLALARGEVVPESEMDSQRDAVVARVAALLMVLDGRLDMVTEDDWRLAEMVYETSSAVRDQVLSAARERRESEREAAVGHRARAAAVAQWESAAADSKVRKLAEWVASRVAVKGPLTISQLKQGRDNSERVYVEPAIDLAQREGWVDVNGSRVSVRVVDEVAA